MLQIVNVCNQEGGWQAVISATSTSSSSSCPVVSPKLVSGARGNRDSEFDRFVCKK